MYLHVLAPMHLDSYLVYILSVKSMVGHFRVYMDHGSPLVRVEFELEIKELNRHDRYFVAIKVTGDIVSVHIFLSDVRTLIINNFQTWTWLISRMLFEPLCHGLNLCKTLF